MHRPKLMAIQKLVCSSILIIILVTACLPEPSGESIFVPTEETQNEIVPAAPLPLPEVTLPPDRPQYFAGELVEYIVQTGDTLPAIAVHFNTTESEIRAVNDVLPDHLTTLPMGLPLQIPIYYQPLWGSSYQIIPDAAFVNGPNVVDFDTVEFVAQSSGWLKNQVDFTSGSVLKGGEIIDYVAQNYSISPRILLAVLEYQTGALSNSLAPDFSDGNLLGFHDLLRTRLLLQLNLAANTLNNGYYGWSRGTMDSFTHVNDGRLEYGDPWQNAGTIALHYYFSNVLEYDAYRVAISDIGFQKTYFELFGDPWQEELELIPGSLEQPYMQLPFEKDVPWTYTGAPHTGWGDGKPWSAIDFAPPGVSGCEQSSDWITAVADGVIARTAVGQVFLDLDGDGDERTGWVVFYMHVRGDEKVREGAFVTAGSAIGHPSCEGGSSTGTHVHMARKYNGEWITAYGPLAFEMEGWIVKSSGEAYQGTLERYSNVVTATDFSGAQSQIISSGSD